MEMKTPKMETKEEEEEDERKMRRWPLMKAAEFLEFQMQALVYRYIEAGLRVPPHLVVPIWKSLALSSSTSSASNYLIHHNNLSSSMLSGKVELEPTRCRRTDGKKWRCSNTVLPSEKYCERHMHRGRKRSRKLVESSCYDVASSSVSSIKQEGTSGFESNNESQKVSQGTMSVSSNAQVVTVASLPVARVSESVTCPPLMISESTSKSVNHGDRRRKYMEMSYNDFIKQRESSTRIRVRVPVADDERLPSVQKLFPEESDISLDAARYRKNDIIARSREWKNLNVNGGFFPGIHFASPDTVLQDRGGFGLHRVETDGEPGRCRRTDGKKWRCSKVVLSGEKYCDKHMNRGVRKKDPVDTNNSTDNAGFSPLTMKPAATSASCDDGHVPKLSVSFLGVPLYQVPDEKVTSSCSTDTTITDTDLMGKEDYEEVLSLCSSGV